MRIDLVTRQWITLTLTFSFFFLPIRSFGSELPIQSSESALIQEAELLNSCSDALAILTYRANAPETHTISTNTTIKRRDLGRSIIEGLPWVAALGISGITIANVKQIQLMDYVAKPIFYWALLGSPSIHLPSVRIKIRMWTPFRKTPPRDIPRDYSEINQLLSENLAYLSDSARNRNSETSQSLTDYYDSLNLKLNEKLKTILSYEDLAILTWNADQERLFCEKHYDEVSKIIHKDGRHRSKLSPPKTGDVVESIIRRWRATPRSEIQDQIESIRTKFRGLVRQLDAAFESGLTIEFEEKFEP